MLLNESDFVPKFEENNMTDWEVIVPPYVLPDVLQRQLRGWSKAFDKPGAITFHILFPNDYPKSVPFVRVVRPRFKYRTGHVTLGGSICNEMLTPAGWREMSVEALIYAVLGIMQDGNAQIQVQPDVHCSHPHIDYELAGAQETYKTAARVHGWKV